MSGRGGRGLRAEVLESHVFQRDAADRAFYERHGNEPDVFLPLGP
ncbi:hypothetical protein ACIGXQ_02470 [Streptomyces anulatus]